MGFFGNLFGGSFDTNGDGKTTWGEEFLAFKIFEDNNKKDESDDANLSNGTSYAYTGLDQIITDEDDTEDDNWRITCEDGSEYDVIPEFFETEDEYYEALEEAKAMWGESDEDDIETISPDDYETEDEYEDALLEETDDYSSDTSSIPSELTVTAECQALDAIEETDYPNKRQFDAAFALANEAILFLDNEQENLTKEACHFILEKSATVIAANYLTMDNGFIFAQAVKEHFTLPVEIETEDEQPNLFFTELIREIAEKDIPLSIAVWDWCVKEFLPYSKYALFAEEALTIDVINDLYSFPDEFRRSLVCYLGEHPDFCDRIIMNAPELSDNVDRLIFIALTNRQPDTAKQIFVEAIEKCKTDTDRILQLANSVIFLCEIEEEPESMKAFQNNLFPLTVDYIKLGDLSDCLKKMKDYMEEAECDCQLQPTDYETEQEFKVARKTICEESQTNDTEARRMKNEGVSDASNTVTDNNTYIYCGVVFSDNGRIYSYRTEDLTLQIGDIVIVPVGPDKIEREASVAFVGRFSGKAVPYPVEKTRFIIRKSEGDGEGDGEHKEH